MRRIVCADCHGNLSLLENVLKHSSFVDGEDQLIFAGDFCDIGKQTLECLDLLEEKKAVVLFGNHELAHIIGQAITPYDNSLDVVPGLRESWIRNTIERKWKIAHAVGDILITHAGVSYDLYLKLGAEKMSAGEIANEINEYFFNSFIYDADRHLLSMENHRWLVYDDFFSPVWFRPLITGWSIEDSLPAPVKQIAGHTPRESYSAECLEELEKRSFFLIDQYQGGRMDIPGYCLYAMIEDGNITVQEVGR